MLNNVIRRPAVYYFHNGNYITILIFKIKICFEIPFEDLPLIYLHLDNYSIKIYKDLIKNLCVVLGLKLFLAINSKPCAEIYFSKMNKALWIFSEIYQFVNYSSFNLMLCCTFAGNMSKKC